MGGVCRRRTVCVGACGHFGQKQVNAWTVDSKLCMGMCVWRVCGVVWSCMRARWPNNVDTYIPQCCDGVAVRMAEALICLLELLFSSIDRGRMHTLSAYTIVVGEKLFAQLW